MYIISLHIQYSDVSSIFSKVNQRGGADCRDAGVKFSPESAALNETFHELSRQQVSTRNLTKRAAAFLGGSDPELSFLEVTYSELLCADELGHGTLPDTLALFAGFAERGRAACGSRADRVTAVKTSPANPASNLLNRALLAAWAAAHAEPWGPALLWKSEANCLGAPAPPAPPLAMPPAHPLHSGLDNGAKAATTATAKPHPPLSSSATKEAKGRRKVKNPSQPKLVQKLVESVPLAISVAELSGSTDDASSSPLVFSDDVYTQ